MKFVSIDIETTGLDSDNDQILEFGAVIVDTATEPSVWPKMCVMINHKTIHGSAFALNMNSRVIHALANYGEGSTFHENIIHPQQLLSRIIGFVTGKSEGEYPSGISITVAGKNPSGFDIPFLRRHFERHNDNPYSSVNDSIGHNEVINFRHRVIDPAIIYVDWENDEILPDLAECKRRAGMNGRVAHTALEDAMDVAMLIYNKIHG